MKRILRFVTLPLLLFAVLAFSGVGYGRFVIPDTVQVISEQDDYLPPLFNKTTGEVRFLHTVSVKKHSVQTTDRVYAVPLGRAFGIKLFTEGVMIVRTDTVPTENGAVSPAQKAGLRAGDRILAINGQKVETNGAAAQLFMRSEGRTLRLRVQRESLIFEAELTPVRAQTDGQYRVGLWVRDSSAGIGTLTFSVPQYDLFAGLGHAVCDVDTGQILPLGKGEAVEVQITGSYKGRSGTPGELCGVFTSQVIGPILRNTETGLYGRTDALMTERETVPVALYYEVREGEAEILADVDEQGVQAYRVQITKLFVNPDAKQKNLVVKITDPALIDKTGGIVQGMSGSPILQNGMLVGAVTHVFLNDPLQGFGVYAQTMLEEMQQLTQIKKAS